MADEMLRKNGAVKEINRESDLDALVHGDTVSVYFGHNYGNMDLEAREFVYTGTDGNGIIFIRTRDRETPWKLLPLSRNHLSYRHGILVHPQLEMETNQYDPPNGCRNGACLQG